MSRYGGSADDDWWDIQIKSLEDSRRNLSRSAFSSSPFMDSSDEKWDNSNITLTDNETNSLGRKSSSHRSSTSSRSSSRSRNGRVDGSGRDTRRTQSSSRSSSRSRRSSDSSVRSCRRSNERETKSTRHSVSNSRDNTNENVFSSKRRRSRPFICEYCEKIFEKLPAWEKHMTEHEKRSPYKCKQCSKQFRGYNALKYHVNTTHMKKTFNCEGHGQCKAQYTSLRNLKDHIARAHNGIRDQHFCPACQKVYKHKSSLTFHMKHKCKKK